MKAQPWASYSGLGVLVCPAVSSMSWCQALADQENLGEALSFHVHLRNQSGGRCHWAQVQKDGALSTLWMWWPSVWPHCTVPGFVGDRHRSRKDQGL